MSVMPETDGAGVIGGQILSEMRGLSRDVGELRTQAAVIVEQVKVVPDLDRRLRIVELAQAASQGGRDTWARSIAVVAVGAAIAAVIAPFFHH